MASLYHKYNQLLVKRPLITNIITTGTLFGVGDVLAQKTGHFQQNKREQEHQEQSLLASSSKASAPPKIDWARTFRAILYGSAVFAPIGNKWYHILPAIKAPLLNRAAINASTPRRVTVADTITRVAADQLGFAALVGIPMYLTVMPILETPTAGWNANRDRIMEKLNSNWWNTLKTNWLVWPAVQVVNFALVPVQARLLVVNLVSIGWNCYLSMVLNKDEETALEILGGEVKSEDQVMI